MVFIILASADVLMLGDIRRILRKIDLLGFVLEDIFDLHEVVLAVTVGQALRADLADEPRALKVHELIDRSLVVARSAGEVSEGR